MLGKDVEVSFSLNLLVPSLIEHFRLGRGFQSLNKRFHVFVGIFLRDGIDCE